MSELKHVQEGVLEKQNYCWKVDQPSTSRSRVKLSFCSTGDLILEEEQFEFDWVSKKIRSKKYPDFCLGKKSSTSDNATPLYLAWCYDNQF